MTVYGADKALARARSAQLAVDGIDSEIRRLETQIRQLRGEAPRAKLEITRLKKERGELWVQVENQSLLAIAGFLAQQHICDHGTRGWCPACHRLLKEGISHG